MAPPASRRSVVAVEVRASESGPVLRGVILQEGRAATGGRRRGLLARSRPLAR